MTNLIDEGLIHYWGTSWWPPFLIERAIGIAQVQGLIPPAVEEPPYHVNARFIEVDLFEVAKYHGLGITSFEALATGFYTGKYLEKIPEDSRGALINPIPQKIIDNRRTQVLALKEIAEKLNITLTQLMLAWTLRNPLISSTIMGASKSEHVQENASASGIRLSKDALEEIESILANAPQSDYRINQRPD
jgi:aryl-alcohol dehydrogenase-like predicted oxidoreductase